MESSKLVEPADDREHHFLKILQGETQNRVRIPEAICSKLPTDSPRCGLAVVEGPNGASLIVEVNKTQDGTYLEEGWEIFVQETGLKKLDILDFRHDGGMQFHVKVFKGNECPREECFAPVPSPVPSQESHGPREECFTPVPSPLGRERNRHGSSCANSKLTKRDSFNHEKFTSAIEVEGKVRSFSSPFPFFWTSVKLSNACRTTIPAKFAREHLQTNMKGAEEKMDVLLQNKEGGIWELRVCSCVTQNYFSKGWKTFATDNKLKIGDFVIFELIDKRPDAKFVMSFHIYRVPVPSPLGRERKRHGSPSENSMLKKRVSFNHEKFASAIEVESKVKSFSSPFPFFWTSVKLSNVFFMPIPVMFAREHLPTNEKMDVLLQNEQGRTWGLRVSSLVSKSNFIKGWKTFATDNKLKIGDYVIFELIDKRPDAKFVMNFHIYRVPVIVEDDPDDSEE
ncbi:hypothetical protein MKW98_007207 [Papaver atlanticum]|uniref:TF-B3 domain-containing protein n=1 Tax=Papaver atlanticum TaxID=357466 RepID=A0AAD4XH06_9MAGN|nr:hypothetical protein MKW98_007207 [Papaver atlanticum]